MKNLTKNQTWALLFLLAASILLNIGFATLSDLTSSSYEKQATHLEKELAAEKEDNELLEADLKETETKLNATESELNITKQALNIKSDRLKMIDAKNEGTLYQETNGQGLDEE